MRTLTPGAAAMIRRNAEHCERVARERLTAARTELASARRFLTAIRAEEAAAIDAAAVTHPSDHRSTE